MANQTSEDNTKRNANTLKNRGLNTGIPKPNIVRIEVLDGSARLRYLGGLQKGFDSFKTTFNERLGNPNDRIFFGFLKTDSNIELGFTNNWIDVAGAGNILGSIKAAAPKTGDVVQKVGDVTNRLTGLSVSSTGSSTLKQFGSTEIRDFKVDCGWYLPEQLALCNKSLQVLARMMYPRQVGDNFGDVIGGIVNDSLNQISTSEANKNATNVSAGDSGSFGVSATLTKLGLNTFKDAAEWLGGNITLDPLPVRVAIGQFVDIEPLVIDTLTINMSRETFISESGRHLPLFCTVNIGFKFWLRPRPELEFMSLFGTEMFGKSSDNPIKIKEPPKELPKTTNNKTNPQLTPAQNDQLRARLRQQK